MIDKRQYFYALVFFLGAFLVIVLAAPGSREEGTEPAEIAGIKAASVLAEQVKLYTDLIDRVGPEEAQEELYLSGLPFTGQTHLLNHVVGDILYVKYGPRGLAKCKEYFLASCYHGFTLHAIAVGGMEEVKKVIATCVEEGPAVSIQCAHAVGHGFLTSVGYKNLLEGLVLCDDAAVKIKDFSVYNCHDGVFMENIWGVHEGERSVDAWIKDDDSLYPCNEPRIPARYLKACWSNQPALIYQNTGNLQAVGEICLTIKNSVDQESCFNGLARQIHPLAGGNVEKTFMLCAQLPGPWQNHCVTTNAASGFSVGDRDVPYRLCQAIPREAKAFCYEQLFGAITVYARTAAERQTFCGAVLEDSFREQCYNYNQP